MVILDFDIVWRPSPTSVNSSISLPSFLAATKEMKELLSTWNYQPLEQIEDGEIFWDDVEVKNSSAESKIVPPNYSDDSQDHRFLIFPLEETYYDTNFHFSALRDKDRRMAHLFQSIDFVDVHLATVGITETSETSQTFQLIYSDNSIPQFKKFRLDFANQLIGEFKTYWTCENQSEKMYPVLVIQPRHESIRRCCNYQFDVALSYLESLLTSTSEMMRFRSLTCLGLVLKFCQEEPLKVWDVPETIGSERTLRLLKICKILKAEKETRFFIEILCQDFVKPSVPNEENAQQPQLFYVGVGNELVARSIIDLLWTMEGKLKLFDCSNSPC